MIFADHYRALVMAIMETGSHDVNRRTQTGIKLLPRGYMFSLDLSDNILPTCGMRRTRPHIAAAETAWCFMGDTSLGWLRKYTRVWDAFANNNDDIMEAYGYRWRYAFGYDQIQLAISRLASDNTDRRVWISSWDPRVDLKLLNQKTVPCPVGFTLSVYDNCLNSTYVIRSSDVFMGLPHDVMRHALVMRAIANSIPGMLQLGHMSVILAHPHIYETHFELVNVMVHQEIRVPKFPMPLAFNVSGIANDPDKYVMDIRDQYITRAGDWPDYDPKVTVVK